MRKVLDEEGVGEEIEVTEIETFEEAIQHQYPGSPTILINGHDIDPIRNPKYAPTCRAYHLEDGRISPLPSVSMIRRAVRVAKENLKSETQP
ncbi:MAG: DUF2703 domain-containing protein [Candidatus Bathyarchaeia archaeon]